MIVSIVLAIGSQAAALVLAWLPGNVIDAITKDEEERLPWLVGIVLAVGVARALMMSGRRLISGKQALAVEIDMRTALYSKLVRLSFGYYDRHQTGQLMSRATVDLQSRALLPRLRAHLLLPARLHDRRRRRSSSSSSPGSSP